MKAKAGFAIITLQCYAGSELKMMNNAKETQAIETIREEMKGLPGHTGFYYKNLVTGYEAGVRADEAFLAASVIKLPLFLHILGEAFLGRMSLDEKIMVAEEDKVPICGALTLFSGPVEVDVQTLCRLMISISDNTATNVLIRRMNIGGTAQAFRAMGLEKTRLTRAMFDSEASRAGLQNYICPREMGALLEKLYHGTFVSPQVCKEALEVLHLQQVDHKLNGKICGAVPVAHKTGEDDGLSNDVGIVYAKQPFVMCFAGHDTDVYAWEDIMRRGTWALYQAQEG